MEDVVEVEVEEVTPTGTITMAAAAITTPVATPMGMRTYGLEIVVKLDAFRSPESKVGEAVALERISSLYESDQQHSIFLITSNLILR